MKSISVTDDLYSMLRERSTQLKVSVPDLLLAMCHNNSVTAELAEEVANQRAAETRVRRLSAPPRKSKPKPAPAPVPAAPSPVPAPAKPPINEAELQAYLKFDRGASVFTREGQESNFRRAIQDGRWPPKAATPPANPATGTPRILPSGRTYDVVWPKAWKFLQEHGGDEDALSDDDLSQLMKIKDQDELDQLGGK